MADAPATPVLPNDDAARSPTGEILDVRDTPKPAAAEGSPAEGSDGEAPKPADGEAVKPADPAKPDADATKVPDAYDFKAPDGYTIDTKLVETVTPIFKEMGLNQEQAQKLFDVHANALIEAAKAPQATYEQTRAKWQADTLADPDIKAATIDGKIGIEAVKVDIGRALTALNDAKLVSDFRAAMDLTGAGDNPACIKTLWRLAQHISEGRPVAGKGPSTEGQKGPNDRPATGARALYPNLS